MACKCDEMGDYSKCSIHGERSEWCERQNLDGAMACIEKVPDETRLERLREGLAHRNEMDDRVFLLLVIDDCLFRLKAGEGLLKGTSQTLSAAMGENKKLREASRTAKKYLEDNGGYDAQPYTAGHDVWKQISVALGEY